LRPSSNPGQAEQLSLELKLEDVATQIGTYRARVLIDPQNPKLHERRQDNNESGLAKPNGVN
jgi:hypothetical protein